MGGSFGGNGGSFTGASGLTLTAAVNDSAKKSTHFKTSPLGGVKAFSLISLDG
jgi:hypothetical protein